MPFAVGLLKLLFDYISPDSENLYFFFTMCDVMNISSIIRIKLAGAKNIYMYKCSPVDINPSLFSMFSTKYGIKFYSNVNEDLEYIRNI